MSIAVYSAQQTQQLFDLFSAMTDYYAGDPGAHQPLREGARLCAANRACGAAGRGHAVSAGSSCPDARHWHPRSRAPVRAVRQASCKSASARQEAQKMLDSLGFAPDVTERVCFLIAHHHTLDGVDALDWRILLEADFLVNMIEEGMKADAIQCGREKIFRTEMGLRLMERLILKGQC